MHAKVQGCWYAFFRGFFLVRERYPDDPLWELGALHLMALLLGTLYDCCTNALIASCCNINDVIGKDLSNMLTTSVL